MDWKDASIAVLAGVNSILLGSVAFFVARLIGKIDEMWDLVHDLGSKMENQELKTLQIESDLLPFRARRLKKKHSNGEIKGDDDGD